MTGILWSEDWTATEDIIFARLANIMTEANCPWIYVYDQWWA